MGFALPLLTAFYIFMTLLSVVDIFKFNTWATGYGKLLWLITVLLLPIIGAVFYFWLCKKIKVSVLLKNKKRIFLTILFFLCLTYFMPISANAQDATALGNSLGAQFNNAYGSSGGINSNAILPAMSPMPMHTLNGQTQFNAQFECPNSQAFLQILFEPQSTGDFTAIISQDPTLSGHFTYQVQTPVVSGVCNNGFISCTPGTWNNCSFYQWTYNNGDAGFTQVTNDQTLGSCFCNNSSCGFNFFGGFNAISNTFGAGIATFISENSQMAISNVSSSFPTLTYYGQNAQSCTAVAGNWSGSGYQNPAQYYGNPSSLSGAGQDLSTTQLGQQAVVNGQTYNSPYELITNNEYMNQTQTQEKTCQIAHSISFNTVAGIGCPSGSVPAGNDCIPNQTIGSGCSVSNGGGEMICVVTNGVLSCGDQGHGTGSGYGNNINLAEVIANPTQAYSTSVCSQDWCWWQNLTPNSTGSTGSVTWTFNSSHSSMSCQPTEPIILGCGQQCPAGSMLVNGGANAGIACMNVSQVTSDTCSGQDFSKCQLENEQVCNQNGQNCVYIYQNFQYINPSIQPMCYNMDGPNGSVFNVCATGSAITYQDNIANLDSDYTSCPGYTPQYSQYGTLYSGSNGWWIIKKTYSCPSQQITIPSLSREENVENNMTYNSGSGVAVYPDQGGGMDGIQSYSANNLEARWSYTGPAQKCIYSCIVSVQPPRTAVIDQGNAATNGANGTPPDAPTIDKTYMACIQDPNTKQWTCPATNGQQIIQPCICLDQGAQSIAIMSAMVSAGQDMICSQQ